MLLSPQEQAALNALDLNDPRRLRAMSIADVEMICQHDMKVRGQRLTAYHIALGDIADYLPELNAA